MARLSKFEIDAVVETTMEQIDESLKNNPEQKEFNRLCQLEINLEKQATQELKDFRKQLVEKYSKLSEGLSVTEGNYDSGVYIKSPNRPTSSVNKTTIEREIIIANISGNVQETIQKIVDKYTKQ